MVNKQPPPIPTASRTPPPMQPASGEADAGNQRQNLIHAAALVLTLIAIAILLILLALMVLRSAASLETSESTAATGSAQGTATTQAESVQLGTEEEQDSDATKAAEPAVEDSDDADRTDITTPIPLPPSDEPVEKNTSKPASDDVPDPEIANSNTEVSNVRVLNAEAIEGLQAGGTNPLLIGTRTASTVFVIDKSGSMSGNALHQVRISLLQAIEKLKKHQRFSVIFFDDVPRPLQPPMLLEADEIGKATARKFIASMSPSGGTNPYDSTVMALNMNPESVVVLSDGEFELSEVARITQKNQSSRQTPIHCVGLQMRIKTLQRLARDNAGTYTTALTSK